MNDHADEPRSTTLADGALLVEDSRGSALMSRVREGVLLYVCSGYYGTPFFPPMIAPVNDEIRSAGSLVLLVDGWELKSVEAAYREAWTDWFRAHAKSFRMTLLVRSKLMQMSASLANLFSGTRVVTSHSTIRAWECAVASDVPGFRRTTSS